MQFKLAIVRSVGLTEIECIAETNESLFLDLIQLADNVQQSLALSLTPSFFCIFMKVFKLAVILRLSKLSPGVNWSRLL